MEDNKKEILEIIEDLKIGMLTTNHDSMTLVSRPMYCMVEEGSENQVLMVTDLGKNLVSEIRFEHDCNLAFQDHENRIYLSLVGGAYLSKDSDLKSKVWDDSLELWYPNGQRDPNVVVVEFKIENAFVWEGRNETFLGEMIEVGQAFFDKQRPKIGTKTEVHYKQ